jgi:hypothetical protein
MTGSEGRAPRKNPADTRPAEVDSAEISRRVRRLDEGRYARAWREGFAHGALDALRSGRLRLPPETWPTLDQLADEYVDGYGRDEAL